MLLAQVTSSGELCCCGVTNEPEYREDALSGRR